MAFKISKAHASQLDELVSAYEHARAALAEWLDELASEWEEEFNEKSEKWQEGEAGQAAQEHIDTVRSWFDELPEEPSIDVEALQ